MAINLSVIVLSLMLLPLLKLLRWGRRDAHLPPGPPTTPFLGNIRQLPSAFVQLRFTEWAQAYGDVVSVKVFNSTMIILSSPSAIRAVLDKKGSSTGGRPRNLLGPMFRGLSLILENSDAAAWKRGRKTMHQFFAAEQLQQHLRFQQAEASQLLNDLLDDPTNIYTHIMRTTYSTMTSLLYGKRTPTYYGSDAEAYFEGIKLLSTMLDTSAFPPVDIMPFVEYIPKWLAPWTAHIEKTRSVRTQLYSSLIEEAEEKFANGHRTNSYVEGLLKNQEILGLSRDEVARLGMVSMDGGVESTASVMQNVVLALVVYQECQRKAQEEMDRVIGSTRMPMLSDYQDLPYLRAFMLELQRFRALTPIGVPHMATEDLTYNGYVIPKGSMVFQNTWGIFHNPALYDEPDIFCPERFLGSKHGTKHGADLSDFRDNLAFGSGRRICPGEQVAHQTIALNVMNIIWAFNLRSDTKMTLDLDNYIVPGLDLAPKPFVCKATIRNGDRERLVRGSYMASRRD